MNRKQVRGKRLDKDCYNAKTIVENGKVLCWGLFDLKYEDLAEKCKNCRACVSGDYYEKEN